MVTHSPTRTCRSFQDVCRRLAMIWGLYSTAYPVEKSPTETQGTVLLIDLPWLLETHRVILMDESTNPRLIAWFSTLISLSKPQAKINSPSIYNFAKCAFAYWLLNLLWLLKGWLHPSEWARLHCGNKQPRSLSPNDDHSGHSGVSNMSPAAPSFWTLPDNLD